MGKKIVLKEKFDVVASGAKNSWSISLSEKGG
jgi:hypothetical protein